MAERLLAPGGCLVGPFDGEFLRLTRNRNVRRDTFNTPPPFVSDEFEEETLYQVAFAPLLRPTEREKPVVVATTVAVTRVRTRPPTSSASLRSTVSPRS